MLFWFAILFALLAAAILGAVVFRHWKEIRLLDPDTIRAERERRTREHIVMQRLERRLSAFGAPLKRQARALLDRVIRSYNQAEERLARLSSGQAASVRAADDAPEAVKRLLDEAAALARTERFAEAERIYLEVLKRNERLPGAWRGLGALYLAQKQYAQAKETYEFLERIHAADDACYAALAEIAEAEGDLREAETQRKRAVSKNPKSAPRHAELAEYYLRHKSPEFALASARRAVTLDPETPRHLEICLESAILVRDRDEAERCYDKLRLVSDDRGKLRAHREKIDGLVS